MPSDPTQFAKTETKRLPNGHGSRVFVQTGGKADGIGKLQAEKIHL
jgi:hypothetical protein